MIFVGPFSIQEYNLLYISFCVQIDSQSSEIERLFEENSSLSSDYQESLERVATWENQVPLILSAHVLPIWLYPCTSFTG